MKKYFEFIEFWEIKQTWISVFKALDKLYLRQRKYASSEQLLQKLSLKTQTRDTLYSISYLLQYIISRLGTEHLAMSTMH